MTKSLDNRLVELFKNAINQSDKIEFDKGIAELRKEMSEMTDEKKSFWLSRILTLLVRAWNHESKHRGFTDTRKKVYDYMIEYKKEKGFVPRPIQIAKHFGWSRQNVTPILSWLNKNNKIKLWKRTRKYEIINS